MKCLTPILIKNPMFKKLLNQPMFVYVPCNSCVNCLKNTSDEWCVRAELESKMWDSSFFVTLTYNDDTLPSDGVCKRHIQLFHKKLRNLGFNFKYIVISEYGTHTHRAHYHGLYFGLPEYVFDEFWKHGFTLVKSINPNNIRYVCSYHILKNEFVPEGMNENFKVSSKNLGYESFLKFELENAKKNDWRYLIDYDGNFHRIPRYFRKKFNVKFDLSSSFEIKDRKNFNVRLDITKQFKQRKFKSKKL